MEPMTEQDLNNLEFVLNSWTDKPPSDSELAAYFLDEKALEALTNTSVPMNFTPQASPLSSPLYNPPSSPSVSSLQGSDSDEFEQDFFSNTDIGNDEQLFSSCDITSGNPSLGLPPFNFDSNESAFKVSFLPTLPASTSHSDDNKSQNESSGKAPKKRRRQNEGKPPLNAKLSELTEEQLLLFDSNEIEVYIKNLSASRTISSAEEKNLKKIRRLIKNREYAQSSRNKKKAYVDELEAKMNLVEQEKAALQQRVNALEMENRTLKYHLARILKNSGKISSHSTKTGLSLFAVFFCFGLFAFGAYNMNSNVASSTVTSDFQSFKSNGQTGRYILSITEEGINQDSSFVKKFAPKFLQDMVNGVVGEQTKKLEKHYKPIVTITSVETETNEMPLNNICDDSEIVDKNGVCIKNPNYKDL